MVTANQNSIIDTHTEKETEPKHNTIDGQQITREGKKTKGEKDLQNKIAIET